MAFELNDLNLIESKQLNHELIAIKSIYRNDRNLIQYCPQIRAF